MHAAIRIIINNMSGQVIMVYRGSDSVGGGCRHLLEEEADTDNEHHDADQPAEGLFGQPLVYVVADDDTKQNAGCADKGEGNLVRVDEAPEAVGDRTSDCRCIEHNDESAPEGQPPIGPSEPVDDGGGRRPRTARRICRKKPIP